jgi:DNA mismatch repair ATPase MutS
MASEINTNKKKYAERVVRFETELNHLKKQNRLINFLRLLLFLIATGLSIGLKEHGAYVITLILGLTSIPFLILVKQNVKYAKKIKLTKELLKINKNELEAINGNISAFHPGKEFIAPTHPYSFDLDIFGEESIFQNINRTCTGGGANFLAEALKKPLHDIKEIEKRQEASKELSVLLDWRQNFQATGNITMETEQGSSSKVSFLQSNTRKYSNDARFHDEILGWLKEPFLFLNKKLLKILLYVFPIISIVLLVLMIAGYINAIVFILYGLVQLLLPMSFIGKVNLIQSKIGRKVELLNKYESLLKIIENQDFNSNVLKTHKTKLQSKSNTASVALQKLKKLVRALDNRNNILFGVIANAYLSWDIQVVLRTEQWRKEKINKLPEWLDVIYEFDFLSSLGTFSYNHPEFTFPKIKQGDFYLEMKEAGHPLLNPTSRVDNDITIDGHKQLLVLTGANMAGKSTFLRTVGVNMILALAGAVTCTKKMIISPIELHTSVRTSDSVQKNESYFFAELKRLKSIIDRMQAGENLFIIIDEMLRGTNSKDKHHGSEALIEQLIRLNGSGLIATHDIALGSLADKYPENVKNYRFEVEIENNELLFDYKLKTGVSQNLNATFLMKKMGITI